MKGKLFPPPPPPLRTHCWNCARVLSHSWDTVSRVDHSLAVELWMDYIELSEISSAFRSFLIWTLGRLPFPPSPSLTFSFTRQVSFFMTFLHSLHFPCFWNYYFSHAASVTHAYSPTVCELLVCAVCVFFPSCSSIAINIGDPNTVIGSSPGREGWGAKTGHWRKIEMGGGGSSFMLS